MYRLSTVAQQKHIEVPADVMTELGHLLKAQSPLPTPALIEVTGAGRVTEYPVLTLAMKGRFGAAWWNRVQHASTRRRVRLHTDGAAFRHLDGRFAWVPTEQLTLKPEQLCALAQTFIDGNLDIPEMPGVTWRENPLVTRGPRVAWLPDLAGRDANTWLLRALAGRCVGLGNVLRDLGPLPEGAAAQLDALHNALQDKADDMDPDLTVPHTPALPPAMPWAGPKPTGLEIIKAKVPEASDELRILLADITNYLDRHTDLGSGASGNAINDEVNELACFPVLLDRWAEGL